MFDWWFQAYKILKTGDLAETEISLLIKRRKTLKLQVLNSLLRKWESLQSLPNLLPLGAGSGGLPSRPNLPLSSIVSYLGDVPSSRVYFLGILVLGHLCPEKTKFWRFWSREGQTAVIFIQKTSNFGTFSLAMVIVQTSKSKRLLKPPW